MKKRRRRKPTATEKLTWIVVGAGAAMIATSIVEQAMESGWRAVRDDEPPISESLATGWKEAILWTAVSALALGLSQTLARRGAAIGWQRYTGKEPPV